MRAGPSFIWIKVNWNALRCTAWVFWFFHARLMVSVAFRRGLRPQLIQWDKKVPGTRIDLTLLLPFLRVNVMEWAEGIPE